MEIDITKEERLNPELFAAYGNQFINLMNQILKIEVSDPDIIIDEAEKIADYFFKRNLEDERLPNLKLQMGSCLGETIIKKFPAKWHWSENQQRWVVRHITKKNDRVEFNVFNKVDKRFSRGEEDNLQYWWGLLKDTISKENGADF
jgi:hypothetical protein